ncbi:hypothetical protein AF72_12305 [Xylella taiwanensis]|uniref:Uncharacterized protein n=1 Tax=Xylella taiwanensis TaxID=1444770 RepID=Z9JG56_9GAMM|nr:hypothetical protein AF72_12305 [Xylella taiwanensis]
MKDVPPLTVRPTGLSLLLLSDGGNVQPRVCQISFVFADIDILHWERMSQDDRYAVE